MVAPIAGKRVGLIVAAAFHAAVLLAIVYYPTETSPQFISVPVTLVTPRPDLDSRLLAPDPHVTTRFERIKGKLSPSAQHGAGERPLRGAGSTKEAVPSRQLDEGHFNKSFTQTGLASDTNNLPNNWGMAPLTYSAAPNLGEPKAAFAAQSSGNVTVTHRTDWQDNAVEDKEVKYAAAGSAIQLTTREASSAGLLGTNFSSNNNFDTANDPHQSGFGQAQWTAKSQRVDWTVVKSNDFGVTVFGYQNEIGSGFKPFGETRKEFTAPGTKTIKAGGQIRIGAMAFGFAHARVSNIANPSVTALTAAESSGNLFAAQESDAKFFAVQNEASISLSLPQLLPGLQGSIPNLLPNLWASVSDRQPIQGGIETGTANTNNTSFGATWNWSDGNATVGYWNYASSNSPGLPATWGGRGFDANVGMYRSSFGIYAGVSYGQSEDTALAWQSARTLYNSYVTVSYKPDKFPAISVTAATGNYNSNAIAYSAIPSDLYANSYTDSSHDAYSSLTVGLDLTSWLFGLQTLQSPSLKLVYRYSENTYFDQYAQSVKNTSSLVAMMMQGRF